MNFDLDFGAYSLWSLYVTIAFFVLAILGFIFKWGTRFRFVGITGFMGVLTVGLFGLSLGLFGRVVIPNATQYNLVYDTGANQAVITVPIDITPTQLEATLEQAAVNLFSYGRTAVDNDTKLTVRARVQAHQDGYTYPLYLGQIRRSLYLKEDENAEIKIYEDKFEQLNSFLNS